MNEENFWKKALLQPSALIKDAIEVLSEAALRIVLITDENLKLLGTVTDGDIRRGLLDKQSLEDPVSGFIKNTFAFIKEKSTQLDSFQEFAAKGIRRIPVLDIDKKYII